MRLFVGNPLVLPGDARKVVGRAEQVCEGVPKPPAALSAATWVFVVSRTM